MPISRLPFPLPSATRDDQHCSPAISQQRTQFDIQAPHSSQNNREVVSSRQEPYLYPEYDPLE